MPVFDMYLYYSQWETPGDTGVGVSEHVVCRVRIVCMASQTPVKIVSVAVVFKVLHQGQPQPYTMYVCMQGQT